MGVKFIREQIIKILGGRCVSPECKWLTKDGTLGCDNLDCLQIDHKRGKGRQSAILAGNTYRHYKEILTDPSIRESYQLLCANCNWIKRHKQNENGGGRKPSSRKLSAVGRDSYISLFRSLTRTLPSLQNPEIINKTESQIAKLKHRLELDGVDIQSLLPGGKPQRCKKCGKALEGGFWVCDECKATRKRMQNSQAKKQRLIEATKAGRIPCHSCVIRDARPSMATCKVCSENKKVRQKLAANAKVDLENKERDRIIETLRSTKGKVKGKDGAAIALSMSESKLRYRLCKFGITAAGYAAPENSTKEATITESLGL